MQDPQPEELNKIQLHQLADELLLGDQSAIQSCVQFIQAETRGIWHGRARAKMCRRLKHIDLPSHLQSQLVQCITRRLTRGVFSEQFKDQLRLVMVLDSPYLIRAAEQSINSEMAHVARLSSWVIVRHKERIARIARATQSKQERT